MKHTGALITFEGLDGCGKTTQSELAAERFRRQGRSVMETKEPGGTTVGRQIRGIVLDAATGPLTASTEVALMFAARSQHIEEVILPALASGKLVLCDRFTDSTIAYQGYGRGIELDVIQTLDALLCHGVRPDLTLLLDIDPQTAVQRIGSRNLVAVQHETRFEEQGLEFFRRVGKGYHEIAEKEPKRVRVLDALGSITEVHERVIQAIDEFLQTRGGRPAGSSLRSGGNPAPVKGS